MRFIAVIADNWEQFVTRHANHGFHFDKRLGTATREGAATDRRRVCIVFIDAHDQAFTREKSQGVAYDKYRVISKTADPDVVACVRSRSRADRPMRELAA
jgi:hypothetical protein